MAQHRVAAKAYINPIDSMGFYSFKFKYRRNIRRAVAIRLRKEKDLIINSSPEPTF